MLFFREDIFAKLIGSEKLPVESFYLELNLRGQKWLKNCLYNPSKAFRGEHLKLLNKNLDLQSSKYECFVFVGDSNVGIINKTTKDFYNLFGVTSLNNKPTCYKNPAYPSCIDLILKICPKYFQNTT